jgi:hypothetical protein
MSDFMKDRERELKRAIEGDERRLREMDRMIEGGVPDSVEQMSTGTKAKRILFGFLLPVALVAGFFIGIVKLWGWIFG